MGRHFRGATRQRGARQRPDAEIHLVDAVVAWCKERGCKVAVEVDRGTRIADVLAYDQTGDVHLFEVKIPLGSKRACDRLRLQSAHFKYAVGPYHRIRQEKTVKRLTIEGIGLLGVKKDHSVEVQLSPERQSMTRAAQQLAVARILEEEV